MGRPLTLIVVLAIVALLTACSGDDPDEPPPPTASAVPEATATVPLQPTAPPRAPTPVPGVERVPSAVWSIEANRGQKSVIFEDVDALVLDASFSDAKPEVEVVYRPYILSPDVLARRTTLDGTVLSVGPQDEVCRQSAGGIDVKGTHYDALYCGPVSPDGRWLLFEKRVRQVPWPPGSNYLVLETDMWAFDLASGAERKLQEGLIHCGGCDGRFGPAFSTTSRYAYFAETGGEGRVWLADLTVGSSREISRGPAANQQGRQPDFSPVGDLIVYLDQAKELLVEDLQKGITTRLNPPADAAGRFDATGGLVYVADENRREPQQTQVFSSTTGALMATLAGAPSDAPYWVSEKPTKVVVDDASFVAVLENVPGCGGTGIYKGASLVDCVDATGASISPDARRIAFARATGYTGQVQYPGGGSVALVLYEIVLYDLASGTELIVASDAISSEQVPPVIVWNEASSHFMVRWPLHPGL